MSKKKKNRFANAIIILCVVVGLAVTTVVLLEYHRLGVVIPSDVLGKLLLFWGGELLMIALRQVFGSDIVNKTKTEEDYL